MHLIPKEAQSFWYFLAGNQRLYQKAKGWAKLAKPIFITRKSEKIVVYEAGKTLIPEKIKCSLAIYE